MGTMRSAGKANKSDMAALLEHADSDGLLRDSGAGDSQTMHRNGLLCAFRRTYVFRRVQRGVAHGWAGGAPLR